MARGPEFYIPTDLSAKLGFPLDARVPKSIVETLHEKEVQIQPNVPFKPFAEIPEVLLDLMQRGITRAITAEFSLEDVKGRILVAGGLRGDIRPQDYTGDDPYPLWTIVDPHYELYPELFIPPIQPAIDLMERYILRITGALTHNEKEEFFDKVSDDVFQDHKDKGRLSLGNMPGHIPSILIDEKKIHQLEATWIRK